MGANVVVVNTCVAQEATPFLTAVECHYNDVPVDVHGGLTFANVCQPDPTEHGICHVADSGEPDHVYWLGFYCAHGGDMSPGSDAMLHSYRRHLPLMVGIPESVYRTLEYVQAECASLAAQLAGLKTLVLDDVE